MKNDEKKMMKDFLRYAKLECEIDTNEIEKYQNIQMSYNNIASIAKGYEENLSLPSNLTPVILEERRMNVTGMDVFSRLMMERIIFLGEAVTEVSSNIIIAQLLYLNSVSTEKDITLYINSPGGSVRAGLGIYDTMHFVTCDVGTMCTGMAASMAFVLAISGTKGKRSALPHSRFMQHQPMGGAYGQASDIEISFKEIQTAKKDLYEIISKKTGKSYKTIEKDADRDFWMSAEEALKYGCIDDVIKTID